ncbi:putative transporter [Colletotrichum gloeosporioides]|uniref:Putative transporter n=1 Tax=Colletotrichum gloeosporioides TaxID=474922 RepID=A0A8H4CDY7_COLGL|nr:putative transporter [Colletotrichum gloeosporioides]KAF3801999.1 putative transporter [Colletotrichum gloeosporioides]
MNPHESPEPEQQTTANTDGINESKPSAAQLENIQEANLQKFKLSKSGGDVALALFENVGEIRDPIDPEEDRKLVRKVDWMILPYIAVCYAFFYGTEYNWLSSVFYFGFLVWALPTNFLLQRFPIAKYLGANIFAWGTFLVLQAVAPNFTVLAVLRAISGAAEACADPAFMIITSMWYTRREQPIKVGLWYTANGIGIALGGLLGYGIGNIKGALASWKYEFIIVGALCCAWGIVIAVFLPDNPITSKTLSQREKKIVIERLRENQTGVENKKLKLYQVREAFADFKLYFFFMIALLQAIVNGGTSNFGTLIIKGFDFSTLITAVLQIPYGVLIFIAILACVFINDRLPPNNRCFMLVLFLLPNVAGAFGLRFVPDDQRVARLICCYLTGSINASFVLLLSLQTANIAGHTKKVVTSACLFLGYCVGNIAGPFIYKSDQAPNLPPRPPFLSLPLDPSGPPGNAWGLYGKDDRLGALNLLTPAIVAAAAASEIRTGDRVSLDWSLNNPSQPSFDRAPFESKLVNRAHPNGEKRTVNDDILHFNTQCSSQWDGFRHYDEGYQKAKRYYNNTTQDDLENPEKIGIDAWVEKGGIVGRGVLLDYASFCARHALPLDAFTSSDITLEHLKQVAAEQNVTFQSGDILLIRSGFTAGYNAKDDAAQKAVAARASSDFLGVEPTKDVLRWIWETGFAAVAGDAPSFERAPIAGPHTAVGGVWKGEAWEEEMQSGGLLHQWLLGGWGLPIGEMFDLEALSVKCAELGRWTFFVSSMPLKVPGGVASPPNAVAIF